MDLLADPGRVERGMLPQGQGRRLDQQFVVGQIGLLVGSLTLTDEDSDVGFGRKRKLRRRLKALGHSAGDNTALPGQGNDLLPRYQWCSGEQLAHVLLCYS